MVDVGLWINAAEDYVCQSPPSNIKLLNDLNILTPHFFLV